MTRENRFNLMFLVLFLAISVPGATILFFKKLDPQARIMYNPPSVRKSLAYMVPQITASDVVRTYPPALLGWVDDTSRESLGKPAYRTEEAGGRRRPLVGDARLAEVLAFDPTSGELSLLIWETIDVTSLGVPGELVDQQKKPIPEPIRELLRGEGYTRPPDFVTILNLRLFPDQMGSLDPLPLSWTRSGRTVRESLPLPSPPLSRSN